MAKNKFVAKGIKKHGCDLGRKFLNRNGTPISRAAIQKWKKEFPPARAIEWEQKIGDPRYITAPSLYPPSEYRKKNGK